MANSGRRDFDQLFRAHSVPPGEPYFVLRAQDAVAAATVYGYVQLAKDEGAEEAFLELAAKQADAMAAWPKKKLPDADLSEPERKQLAYAWSRRAWNRGQFSAEAIAEARGRAAAAEPITTADFLVSESVYQVLRLMNFQTVPVAHLLRADGADIPRRCEDEQAYVLLWLLRLVLDHGPAWPSAADKAIKAARARLKARSAANDEVAGDGATQ